LFEESVSDEPSPVWAKDIRHPPAKEQEMLLVREVTDEGFDAVALP
jgi:hypothetical protein